MYHGLVSPLLVEHWSLIWSITWWKYCQEQDGVNNMSDQYREEWFKPGNLRSRTEQTTANNISYHIDQLNRSVTLLLTSISFLHKKSIPRLIFKSIKVCESSELSWDTLRLNHQNIFLHFRTTSYLLLITAMNVCKSFIIFTLFYNFHFF